MCQQTFLLFSPQKKKKQKGIELLLNRLLCDKWTIDQMNFCEQAKHVSLS